MSFNSIANLRDHDEPVRMEPWQLEEIRKCARDPIYFIRNYVYINTKDKGTQLFKMWEFQEELLKKFIKYRYNIAKWPRQSGKSSVTRAYLLWYGMFHKDKVIAILGNKLSLAQEQLQHLKESYIMLPYWMQPGVKKWAARAIQFSHNTRIVCHASSADNIRGMALNVLWLDEFAFVKPHLADEFISSVFPAIAQGQTTKILMTSTPCGMNHFFRMWEDAAEEDAEKDEDWNEFIKSEIPWNAVPGRDEKWARKERKRIGEIRFNQEFMCDFVGSVSTLIDHHFLKTMQAKKPLKIPNLPKFIKVWELPRKKEELEAKNWEYVASLDSGYGMHADNTVLQILLVKSNITAHQVAKMSTNNMDIDKFCKKANMLLQKYHCPALIIEQNGPGIAAMQFFHLKAEYENILHFDPKGKHMGMWATEKLKDNACVLLKTYVQRKFVKIYDRDTINELYAFGRLTQKKWGGLGGNNDDHVTSLYWITYYLQSQLFYGNIVEVNIKSFAEDDVILSNEEQKAQEDQTLYNMKDPNFHEEELEKGAKYLPEEMNPKDSDMFEDGTQIDTGGSLFFRR